jgi:hypothetical protein
MSVFMVTYQMSKHYNLSKKHHAYKSNYVEIKCKCHLDSKYPELNNAFIILLFTSLC